MQYKQHSQYPREVSASLLINPFKKILTDKRLLTSRSAYYIVGIPQTVIFHDTQTVKWLDNRLCEVVGEYAVVSALAVIAVLAVVAEMISKHSPYPYLLFILVIGSINEGEQINLQTPSASKIS